MSIVEVRVCGVKEVVPRPRGRGREGGGGGGRRVRRGSEEVEDGEGEGRFLVVGGLWFVEGLVVGGFGEEEFLLRRERWWWWFLRDGDWLLRVRFLLRDSRSSDR